jgi:Flp pilus assembly protein TadD
VLTLGGALELSPNEPEIYRALGKVWLERPRDDRAFLSKAREALERVASSPAATSGLLTLYGRALLQGGDVDAAEHALQQATLRFPIDPQALILYAATAEKQSHLEPARQALIQYSSLTSNDAELAPRAARIAALSLRLNDPDTAASWLRKAAAASPGDLGLLATLADVQIRTGDRERRSPHRAGSREGSQEPRAPRPRLTN